MKCRDVLRLLKITRQTLCKYVKNQRIRVETLPNGQYDYNKDDVYRLINRGDERMNVLYARVSSSCQKNDLLNQIETLESFCHKNEVKIGKIYKDVCSGMKLERKDFQTLLDDVTAYKVNKIFVTYKDRLSRISFDTFKSLFEKYGTEIIVLNDIDNPKEMEKEVFEEIISLLHCFSMKMYSSRRRKKLELMEKELLLESECTMETRVR